MQRLRARSGRIALLVGALVLGAAPLAAQSPTVGIQQLSLEQAITMAESRSSTLGIARAGVLRASGTFDQARSQFLPQLNASAGYTRTLRSQFSGFNLSGSSPDSSGSNNQSLCAPRIASTASAAARSGKNPARVRGFPAMGVFLSPPGLRLLLRRGPRL